MKLWDIIKTVGTGVISTMVPGGPFLVGAINEMLPDDKKLPNDATGDQVQHALDGLPPTDRARIMEKEFDVDITQIKESHSTVRAMLESDANNPQSTRPYIAKQAFHVIAFAIVTVVSIWAISILTDDPKAAKVVMDGWPFVVAVIAPFVVLLHSYFGVIKVEARDRLNAATGTQTPNIIGNLISAFKK